MRALAGVAVALLFAAPASAGAQAQPAGEGRTWLELGLAAAQQTNRCVTCVPDATVGGVAATITAGYTLSGGFGVALHGVAFQEISFETTSSSRYVVALGLYTPPGLSMLSLHAGAGWGSHDGDSYQGRGNGDGAVVVTGAALRLPPRSAFALSLVAGVMQSVGGTPSPNPRLLRLGVAIGMATDGVESNFGR